MKSRILNIFSVIPDAYQSRLWLILLSAFLNLVLDLISIVILIPAFIGLFSTGFIPNHYHEYFAGFPTFLKQNQMPLISAVLVFFVIKNFISIKITRFQSDYYYNLSNALSVTILRNHFNKTLLDVKLEKNSALVKDIIFVPNNFVTYVLASLIQIISETALLLSIFILALLINPMATLLLSTMATFVIAILSLAERNSLHSINRNFTEKYNKSFNHLFNAINGYAEIKTRQVEDYFIEQFCVANAALNKVHSKLNADRLSKSKYTETFMVVIILSVYVFSRFFSADSNNTLFISFLFAASLKMIPSVNRILIGLSNFKSNFHTVGILRNNSLAAEKPAVEEEIQFNEKIELRNICFGFENAQPLLTHISLTISKGEIIGVYGNSGSGKSTLANILTTLIMPHSGAIFCDGKPINESTRKSYLKKFAYVPQAPFIVEGTILQNLVLDGASSAPENVYHYLKTFGLHDLIEALPEKIHTFIGSNGYMLSGGQLQRIAVIRALLKNPEILLLDEATNHLDNNLKDTIADILKSVSKDKKLTIIAISHDKQELASLSESIYELKDSAIFKIK